MFLCETTGRTFREVERRKASFGNHQIVTLEAVEGKPDKVQVSCFALTERFKPVERQTESTPTR